MSTAPSVSPSLKVCGNCQGRGEVVEPIPTAFARRNYQPCGFATFRLRCPFCAGTGVFEPVSDGKTAAAGDNQLEAVLKAAATPPPFGVCYGCGGECDTEAMYCVACHKAVTR